VTDHTDFKTELIDEFKARCGDFERQHGRPPAVCEKLKVLKQSAHRTTGYIRRRCSAVVAETTEHKTAVSTSFLRAIHLQDFERAVTLQKKCRELQHVTVNEKLVQSSEFARIKDMIVEWMRSDIRTRADELKAARSTLPEVVYEQRKKGLLSQIKRMLPASSKDIAAMVDEDGAVMTEAEDIARLLNSHWQKVFSSKPTNRERRLNWLENVRGKFQVKKEQLRPTKDIVRQAIMETGSSAPGPDAVPFEIYRALGEEGVELFLEIANAMLDGKADIGEDFNVALMVCIPKGADGFLDNGTPYYGPGGTRPISIVDASNRILASIFCKVLERRIGHRIHQAQKGFLKHRQMLRNVLDIDFAAHKVSVRSRSGAILLFDFKAAFPSLSHDMMWDTLEITGVDPYFIDVVKLFYRNNKHILRIRGDNFNGILVESGVRQGCPLSGLLFAICVDVLLSKLAKTLKTDEGMGAFADDIALVVENFWISSPVIQHIFSEFQDISGLTLNVSKTVMVPLWPFSSEENIRKLMREFCPGWSGLDISRKGKYLGFILGPHMEQEGWTKPLAKFELQAKVWAGMRLGMAMNILVFNMYIAPILEYVAQLLIVDDKVTDALQRCMRLLASGPGNWVELRDLENLKRYGLPANLRTISSTSQAAKLRLLATVASDAQERCRELDIVQMECLRRPFGTWHRRSFYQILNENQKRLGIPLTAIRVRQREDHVRCRVDSIQKLARQEIWNRTTAYDAEFRVRHKMQRWNFKGPEAIVASRLLRNMHTMGRKCKPCVVGSFFRTFWNGWPTTWRMRSAPNAGNVRSCLLGCSLNAVDKLEHYLVCPVAWKVLSTSTRGALDSSRRSLQNMLLAERGLEDSEICLIAVGVYAIARTVQTLRGGDECAPEPVLRLHLKEGMRGLKWNSQD
jgi:hypothetical protein